MENKIWYSIENIFSHEITGLRKCTLDSLDLHESYIEEAIANQLNEMRWPGMWDIVEAKRRLQEGHKFYYLRDHKGVVGHLWIDDDYIYNVFVHPRRLSGVSELFVKAAMSLDGQKEYNLFCDEWNKKAQNFFEKVGFTKKYS
jgi:hypothetical protein